MTPEVQNQAPSFSPTDCCSIGTHNAEGKDFRDACVYKGPTFWNVGRIAGENDGP